MNDPYLLFKTLHILGVILFLGNIIVTAWWKNMANRTRDVKIITFAQRQVTLTDYVFTALGVGLLVASGEYLAQTFMENSSGITWIMNGRLLIIASGIIWISILVPVQIKQARLARDFTDGCAIPAQYWRLSLIWNIFGMLAILLPVIAIYWMVYKPVG